MEMLEIAAFKKDSDKLVCVARIDHRVSRLPIDEEDIANADLIAAAPDMYEALILMCNDCTYKSAYECRVCPTDKALRKARGEAE